MERKSRSILQEISSFVPKQHKDELIKAKADHIISSAIFLLEMIEQYYSDEEADQLKRRFLSSIKGADPSRFTRAVKKIKESNDAD